MERSSLDTTGVTNNQTDESNGRLQATQLHHYNVEPFTRASQQRDNTSLDTDTWLERHARPVTNFWRRQVVATVPHDACRDHFGMNSFLIAYTLSVFMPKDLNEPAARRRTKHCHVE